MSISYRAYGIISISNKLFRQWSNIVYFNKTIGLEIYPGSSD